MTSFLLPPTIVAGALLLGVLTRLILARIRRPLAVPRGLLESGFVATGVLLATGRATDAVPSRWVPALVVLAVVTVVGTVTDLVAHRLPDVLTLPAVPLGLAAAAPLGPHALVGGLAAAAGLGVLFVAVRLAVPQALGGGDVKLSTALGVPLGSLTADSALGDAGVGAPTVWTVGPAIGPVVVAALGLPVIASGVLLVAAALRRRSSLPYGPALMAAVWCELVIVA